MPDVSAIEQLKLQYWNQYQQYENYVANVNNLREQLIQLRTGITQSRNCLSSGLIIEDDNSYQVVYDEIINQINDVLNKTSLARDYFISLKNSYYAQWSST